MVIVGLWLSLTCLKFPPLSCLSSIQKLDHRSNFAARNPGKLFQKYLKDLLKILGPLSFCNLHKIGTIQRVLCALLLASIFVHPYIQLSVCTSVDGNSLIK
jgi:hypothetical protein